MNGTLVTPQDADGPSKPRVEEEQNVLDTPATTKQICGCRCEDAWPCKDQEYTERQRLRAMADCLARDITVPVGRSSMKMLVERASEENSQLRRLGPTAAGTVVAGKDTLVMPVVERSYLLLMCS